MYAGLTVGAAKVPTAPVCTTLVLPSGPRRTKLLPVRRFEKETMVDRVQLEIAE
jgi:hypothetical protein